MKFQNLNFIINPTKAAFNEACRLTGVGKYEEAQEELYRAEKLCRIAFEDQEDELGSELASIRFQLGYLHQLQDRYKNLPIKSI